MYKFVFFENNAGMISLYVLEDGRPVYGAAGFEAVPETVLECIDTLKTQGVDALDGNGYDNGVHFYTWDEAEEELGITLQGAFDDSIALGDQTQLIIEGAAGEIKIYPERMGAAGEKIILSVPATEFEGGSYREIAGRAFISDDSTRLAECAPVDDPQNIRWDEHRAWVQGNGEEIKWI